MITPFRYAKNSSYICNRENEEFSKMSKGNKKIKYQSRVEIRDGVSIPKYNFTHVNTVNYRVYEGAEEILCKLHTLERLLLDYLLLLMTSKNIVINNKYSRAKFLNKIKEYDLNKKEPYKEESVRLAFQGLSNKGILRRIQTGMYVVNPHLFYKGLEKEREDAVGRWIENNREDDIIHAYEDDNVRRF